MHPWLSRLTLVLVFSATAFAGEAPDQATEALAGVRAYRQAHAHQDQLPSRFLAALGMTKGESVSAAGLLPVPDSGSQGEADPLAADRLLRMTEATVAVLARA